MANTITCSINSIQAQFLADNHISPSVMMQTKINEMMQLSHKELQTHLKAQEDRGTTKWQKAMAQAGSYSNRLKIMKEWSNAMGFNDNDDHIDEKIKREEEKEMREYEETN